MNLNHVTDTVLYIGVNDHAIDLFEGQYKIPDGITYNSYVILDEKTAVLDTVDEGFGEEWLANVKEALGKVNAEMNQQRIDIAKHIAPLLTGGVEVDPQDGVDKLLLKLSNQLKDDDVVEFNGASLQLVSSYILNQTIVGVLNKMRAKNSSRVCET